MSRQIQNSILFLILMIWTMQAKAHHIYGGDISYKYLDSANYLVTVQAYQDCTQAATPGGDFSLTCQNGANKSYTGNTCCGKDITPLSANDTCDACTNNVCNFGFGVKKWTITLKINLSGLPGCIFVFSWTECCFTSISNSGYDNFYIESTVKYHRQRRWLER
jgi:hypothetical protein